MEITKSDIIKYFGSVQSYIEFLDLQIDKRRRQKSLIQESELYEIFTRNVQDVSINNTEIEKLLTNTKTALIDILISQITRDENLKKFAYSL